MDFEELDFQEKILMDFKEKTLMDFKKKIKKI